MPQKFILSKNFLKKVRFSFFLNPLGSSKFKDLESLANPQRNLLNQEYNAVTKKIKQVKVKENNFVLYTEQDSIFSLSDEIGRDEWDL